MAHLILNLRNFHGESPLNDTNTQELPELKFASNRFLGNIGAPLNLNQWDSLIEGGEQSGVGNVVVDRRTEEPTQNTIGTGGTVVSSYYT